MSSANRSPALELTPGYRISIPLTHVDGPEERELLRRRHPPHPDIPRNLIAQGWFESGYDTAALEFLDVVHEANRELAARDAEIERLNSALEQFKKEVSWARDKMRAIARLRIMTDDGAPLQVGLSPEAAEALERRLRELRGVPESVATSLETGTELHRAVGRCLGLTNCAQDVTEADDDDND